jgi:hypothetical protein
MLPSEMQQAIQRLMASGRKIFSFDKNISKLYDFRLSSEDKHAASVNHPAVLKTSNQQLFNS